MNAEYKSWLNLNDDSNKARFAKAAIALANHGGGYVVLGFREDGQNLISEARPSNMPEVTQDLVVAALARYAQPAFQCELHPIEHPETRVTHLVIVIPGNVSVPVMVKRTREGVVKQHETYIRKPGPQSAPPHTESEWRTLFRRCVELEREDLLEAIRNIVQGFDQPRESEPDALAGFQDFALQARVRWQELTQALSHDADARFPLGYYEVGVSMVGVAPAETLAEIRRRLEIARRLQYTGWPPFIEFPEIDEHKSRPHGESIETWLGRGTTSNSRTEVASSDYWRASITGDLYTISGYVEDELRQGSETSVLYVDLVIARIAERILFAQRYAQQFQGIDGMGIKLGFTGLRGRRLKFYRSPSSQRYVAESDTYETSQIVDLRNIDMNFAEVMQTLLVPLFESFDFAEIQPDVYRQVLQSMLSRV